ncbi:unnamed protein product [Trichogramma brassicae]|uniref:Uncharacterized protein n=1 Tax=Trichogramma brassicae TaxID=86971 RepID=A0A6H5J4Z7_9HYME|nr:unnamed protein product [Trichogramma brassicae]
MAGDWAWKTTSYKQERDAAWKVVVRRREERETRDFLAAELKKKQTKAEQARKMLEETSAKARTAMLRLREHTRTRSKRVFCKSALRELQPESLFLYSLKQLLQIKSFKMAVLRAPAHSVSMAEVHLACIVEVANLS